MSQVVESELLYTGSTSYIFPDIAEAMIVKTCSSGEYIIRIADLFGLLQYINAQVVDWDCLLTVPFGFRKCYQVVL